MVQRKLVHAYAAGRTTLPFLWRIAAAAGNSCLIELDQFDTSVVAAAAVQALGDTCYYTMAPGQIAVEHRRIVTCSSLIAMASE